VKEIETAEAAAMVSVMAAAVMAAEIEDGVERQFAHSMASCRLIAHGHCLWARDCLWRHDQVAFFCSRAVTEGRDVQLVDREGVGLEDHGRACILRIRIMPRLRRHAEQPRARPRAERKGAHRERCATIRPPPTPPPPHPGGHSFRESLYD